MSLSMGCDTHKRYSLFTVLNSQGESIRRDCVNHNRGTIKYYSSQFPEGTPVVLESPGNWHRIVDEIEASGCTPQLGHILGIRDLNVLTLLSFSCHCDSG